jgi:hypothetical protein
MPISSGAIGRGSMIFAPPLHTLRAMAIRSPQLSTKVMLFNGVTRDGNGNPLGGVTVKLFNTINDVKVAQTVSDGSGNWSIAPPNVSGTFFVVEYLAGAPDRAGTSVNTLVPT